MIGLSLAVLFLLLSHFVIASAPLRGWLVRRLGEVRYFAFYRAVTLAALVWLIVSYICAPTLLLWQAPFWIEILLLPVALAGGILIAAGLSTPNPVIVRQGHLFDQADIVQGILRVSRNPFFWGSGLLALTLIVVLGDAAALLAFGSIVILGIIGSFVLDEKKARQYGAAWPAFAAATSNVPFVAIMRGRQRLSIPEIGRRRLAAGFGLFLVVLVVGAWHAGGVSLALH